jgi:hypothetical protein
MLPTQFFDTSTRIKELKPGHGLGDCARLLADMAKPSLNYDTPFVWRKNLRNSANAEILAFCKNQPAIVVLAAGLLMHHLEHFDDALTVRFLEHLF